jgi:hypothetical protein
MSPPFVKNFTKSAIEKRRFTVDYSCWLVEGESLTNYTVIVQPSTPEAPLSASGAYTDTDNKILSLFIAGGLTGQTYRISLIADTTLDQRKRDDIAMRVT